jgi:hypothetical protein
LPPALLEGPTRQLKVDDHLLEREWLLQRLSAFESTCERVGSNQPRANLSMDELYSIFSVACSQFFGFPRQLLVILGRVLLNLVARRVGWIDMVSYGEHETHQSLRR